MWNTSEAVWNPSDWIQSQESGWTAQSDQFSSSPGSWSRVQTYSTVLSAWLCCIGVEIWFKLTLKSPLCLLFKFWDLNNPIIYDIWSKYGFLWDEDSPYLNRAPSFAPSYDGKSDYTPIRICGGMKQANIPLLFMYCLIAFTASVNRHFKLFISWVCS